MASNILQERLIYKLFDYICDNNPDLLFQLEEERRVTPYLHEKIASIDAVIIAHATEPEYILEERCMLALTQDLRPSKYNYIREVLEEEFSATYRLLIEAGTLKYEAVNLIGFCQELFDAMHFSETKEQSKLLYYAIAGAISEYFDKSLAAEEGKTSWHTTAAKN